MLPTLKRRLPNLESRRVDRADSQCVDGHSRGSRRRLSRSNPLEDWKRAGRFSRRALHLDGALVIELTETIPPEIKYCAFAQGKPRLSISAWRSSSVSSAPSPHKYYVKLRLNRGRQLVEASTNLSSTPRLPTVCRHPISRNATASSMGTARNKQGSNAGTVSAAKKCRPERCAEPGTARNLHALAFRQIGPHELAHRTA